MQQGRLIGIELHGAEPLQGAERWIAAAAQHFVQGLPHHFRVGKEAAGHRRQFDSHGRAIGRAQTAQAADLFTGPKPQGQRFLRRRHADAAMQPL